MKKKTKKKHPMLLAIARLVYRCTAYCAVLILLFCACIDDAAPEVDAVEVVRCEECKHYLACKNINGIIEYYFCNLDAGMVTAQADDFCSLGVRKDD